MTNEQFIDQCLERVEKIEMAGASSAAPEDRLNSMTVLRDAMAMIRREPPTAYVKLMKLALHPKNAGSRSALFGRLAGYALVYSMQSNDVFERVMQINERSVVT